MKCSNCGSEVVSGNRFCNNCGAPVGGENVGYSNYNQQNKNSVLQILLIPTIILVIVSCFLPYLTYFGIEMNYVYLKNPITGDLDFKDGLFVIMLCVPSLICLLCKKKVPVLVLQSISLLLFVLDFANDGGRYGSTLEYGIGFYLLLVFLIISVVLAIIRLVGKNKFN